MIYATVLTETFETTPTFDRSLANYLPQDQSYCAYLELYHFKLLAQAKFSSLFIGL